MKTNSNISISTGTFFKAVLIVIGLWFIWFIRDIVTIFFVSLMLASLIDPFADWFQTRHVPRSLAVLIVYIGLITILALIFIGIIPVLVEQFVALSSNVSGFSRDVSDVLSRFQTFSAQHGLQQNVASSLETLQKGISDSFGSVFTTVKGFVGGLATLVIVFVLTFYMVAEGNKMQKYFKSLVPVEYRPYFSELMAKMHTKLGAWLRAQLILGIVVGCAVYIGLSIVGVKYALLLGLLAGLLEIIPYVGPIFSFIPAIIIAFSQSPIIALGTAIVFLVVQQLENHLLVPKVMEKVTGLNPVVSIIALLVGIKVAGVVGAIFAIPLATMVVAVLEDLFKENA